jgi:HlyD family secretion protein
VGTNVKTEPARPTAAPVDTPHQIVPARSWWALAGLGAVIAGALCWSVFGSVSTVVDCRGIITRPGGLINVVAREGGPIGAVLVQMGDPVRKGQTVARIELPLLGAETTAARAELSRVRSEYAKLVKLFREGDERYLAALAKQRATLKSAITARERRRQDVRKGIETTRPALKEQRKQLETLVAALEQRARAARLALEKLLRAGDSAAASARDLETARRDVTEAEDRLNVARADLARQAVTAAGTESTARREEDRAEESIQGYAVQLAALDREEVERSTRRKERLFAKHSAVGVAEDRLRLLEARERTTGVVSNYDGRVVEIKVDPGQVVRAGTPVVVIELDDQPLQVYAFVPAWGGKKVKPGMKVELTPALIQRAEYGYMVGTVRIVSPFPLSEEGLYQLTYNRSIVEQLTSQGANFAVEVVLERDPATPSGYRWSTGRGPGLAINSGMFCQVRVVTREQPPITLVLPSLRKAFGVD